MNISKYLNQTAIYWATPNPDGLGGYTYSDPVDVPVRWTIKQERFLSGKAAVMDLIEEFVSKVVILSETDFDMGGRMLLGSLLDDDSSSGAYVPPVDALTIEGFEKIPDKKANIYIRKAYLI